MGASIKGITLTLADKKITPYKVAVIAGVSITVSLRTAVLFVYRYDPVTTGFVALEDYPITLVLKDSAQSAVFLTNSLGRADAEFPDANIELRLSPTAAPYAHTAQLNYAYRAGQRTDLTVVFVPDNLVRFYPGIQSI